jgi:hypothetical protein
MKGKIMSLVYAKVHKGTQGGSRHEYKLGLL